MRKCVNRSSCQLEQRVEWAQALLAVQWCIRWGPRAPKGSGSFSPIGLNGVLGVLWNRYILFFLKMYFVIRSKLAFTRNLLQRRPNSNFTKKSRLAATLQHSLSHRAAFRESAKIAIPTFILRTGILQWIGRSHSRRAR